MDPRVLFMEDDKIFDEARKYLTAFKDQPYIFNLGHGLMPGTDPNKVEKLIKFVKDYNQNEQ